MEDQGPAAPSLKFLENTKLAVQEKGGPDGSANPKMAEINFQVWLLTTSLTIRKNRQMAQHYKCI